MVCGYSEVIFQLYFCETILFNFDTCGKGWKIPLIKLKIIYEIVNAWG